MTILFRHLGDDAMMPLDPLVITGLVQICSNVFMTFAGYAHPKELKNKPWIIATLVSRGRVG